MRNTANPYDKRWVGNVLLENICNHAIGDSVYDMEHFMQWGVIVPSEVES